VVFDTPTLQQIKSSKVRGWLGHRLRARVRVTYRQL
tara:strand:+ start:78 stop:185 length:108 start_codon:yes stop_codon:yes gene_type:complete